MRLLKDLLHKLWGHDWTKWETFRTSRDADFGTDLFFQKRECKICGELQSKCRHD